MGKPAWLPEHSNVVRNLVPIGHSGAEIAAIINAQFGTAYSRCAVLGHTHRLGLEFPPKPRVEKKERPKVVNKPRRFITASRMFEGVQNVAEVRLRCVEIVPLNLSLLDLPDNGCRYIAGDDFLYCGHPQKKGSSFCVPHHHLCWFPAAKKENGFREQAA